MHFKNITNQNCVQLVLATFLALAILFPTGEVFADTSILLQGQLAPADINISIDKSQMTLDMAAGVGSASDYITISSTSLIPVKMQLMSFSQSGGTWNPTLITDDPATLNLVNAQSNARVKITADAADPDYAVAPTFDYASPTGTGDTVSTYSGGTYSGAAYNLNFGTIADTDGTIGKSVVLGTTLEASKKRMFSKGFEATEILNFSVGD